MTCYTRHLEEFLPDDPTPADKRVLDEAIRRALNIPAGEDCPVVWARVRERRADPSFADELHRQLGVRG
jgi:hypothetical protein